MTLFLDGDLYATAQDLHLALKRMLALPDYYGMNGDALYDCLSERREPVSVYIATRGMMKSAGHWISSATSLLILAEK